MSSILHNPLELTMTFQGARRFLLLGMVDFHRGSRHGAAMTAELEQDLPTGPDRMEERK